MRFEDANKRIGAMSAAILDFAAFKAARPRRPLAYPDRVRLVGKPSRIGTVIGSMTDGRVQVSWGPFYADAYRPAELERID